VPNDPKAVIAARVAGAPLVKHSPKCKAQMAVAGLAQVLSGKAADGGTGRSSKGWSIFGRK
jgi:MinD-like ATPase involved in chromosome partitioning or flagellar assembly